MNSIDESKVKNIVRHLVEKGNLLSYKEELVIIISKVYFEGCFIHVDEHKSSSSITSNPFRPSNSRTLVIGIKDRNEPIEILWSILHEYGHIIQGHPSPDILKDRQLQYEREAEAWLTAEAKANG
jgi:hypothetical protein